MIKRVVSQTCCMEVVQFSGVTAIHVHDSYVYSRMVRKTVVHISSFCHSQRRVVLDTSFEVQTHWYMTSVFLVLVALGK